MFQTTPGFVHWRSNSTSCERCWRGRIRVHARADPPMPPMPETSMSRTAPLTASQEHSAPIMALAVAIRSSGPRPPLLASNWDACEAPRDRRPANTRGNGGQVSASCFFRFLPACLPAAFSLTSSRLPEQLNQQTEAELIAQSRRCRRFSHREIETNSGKRRTRNQVSACRTKTIPTKPYPPIWPALELRARACCRRGRKLVRRRAIRSAFVASGARMITDLMPTAECALAGFRLARSDGLSLLPQRIGLSLAHLEKSASAAGTLQRRLARAHLQA